MSGTNLFNLGVARVRHLRARYHRVQELTADLIKNEDGGVDLTASQALRLTSTEGAVSVSNKSYLYGGVVAQKPLFLSGIKCRNVTVNYNTGATDASAEEAGVAVSRSAGEASLLFKDGSWKFVGGDLVFGRSRTPGGFVGQRFTIADTASLVLQKETTARGREPTAVFYVDRESPVRTLASQPAALGSRAQAAQVLRYCPEPSVPWVVSFDYEIVNFDTGLLEGLNVASYGPVTGVGGVTVGGGTTSTSGKVFSFDVYPQSQGIFTVSVPAGAFIDAAGNVAPSLAGFRVTYDSVPPAVIRNGPTVPADVYEDQTIPWTLQFDKAVVNFATSSLLKQYNVSQYGVAQTTDQKTFLFDVVAGLEGPVKVAFEGGTFRDVAGNHVAANVSGAAIVVLTPPVPLTSIYDAGRYPNGHTNDGNITWTMTFSDYIANLSQATVQGLVTVNVSFVSLASRSGDGRSFSLNLVAAGPGDVNVSIPAGLFKNLAGNGCTPLTGTPIHFNDTPLTAMSYPGTPAGIIADIPTEDIVTNDIVTNASPVQWTVAFSRPVTSGIANALGLTNCSLGAVSTADNATFTLSLIPDKSTALLSCDVRAGYVADAYGNFNTASKARASVLYDSVAPAVVALRPRDKIIVTKDSPIPWILEFDKDILVAPSPPDAAALSLLLKTVNVASIGNLVVRSGRSFAFDVFPDSAGVPLNGRVVNVSIEAGKIRDAAGNYVASSAGQSVTYDPTPPTATITYARVYSTGPTQTFTVSFDKEVSAFAAGALGKDHNVSMYGPITKDGNVYTFEVTAASSGYVRVLLLGNSVRDRAGNYVPETLGPQAYHTVPTPHPLLSVYDQAQYPTGYTNAPSPIRWILNFNCKVTNMTDAVGNLTHGPGIDGISLASASSDQTSFVLHAHLSDSFTTGDLWVSVPENTVLDENGNGNAYSQNGNILHYDSVRPAAASAPSPSVPGNLNDSPVPWIVSFGKRIVNFEAGKAAGLGLSGCSLSSYVESTDGTTFVLELSPAVATPPFVDLSVSVNAGSFADLYGNTSLAASPARTVRYYGIPPTCVTLAPVIPAAYASASPIPWRAVFDYPVVAAELAGAFGLTGAVGVSGVSSIDQKTFQFDVQPDTAGMPVTGVLVKLALMGRSLFDAGGNAVPPKEGSGITFDDVPPTPKIRLVSGVTSPTAVRTTRWAVSFDEPVSSFSLAKLEPQNATCGNLTYRDMSSFEFDATAIEAGEVRIRIPAEALKDASGNYVPAFDGGPSVHYDPEKPVVTALGPSVPGPTNASPIPWSMTFSKTIANFGIDLLQGQNVNYLVNPSAGTSGTVYTFEVVPTGQGPVTLNVPSGTFLDVSGNYADAFAGQAVIFDTVRPVASLGLEGPDPTNIPVARWFVSFSKPLAEFSQAALQVANGSLTSFTGSASGASFTFYTTASAPGAVSVSLLGTGARDLAGNYALAVTGTVTYDVEKPTVVFSGPTQPVPLNGNWTLQFSKPIYQFSTAGLTGVNASVSPAAVATDNNAAFTFDVTPIASGPYGVDLRGNSVRDFAGNYADAAVLSRATYAGPSFSVGFTLLSGETSPTSHATTRWRLTFGSAVTGLSLSDLDAIYDVSYDNLVTYIDYRNFDFDLTVRSAGYFAPALKGGRVADSFGTYAGAAVGPGLIYDNVKPRALSSATTGEAFVNSHPIPWVITFDKPVVDFDVGALDGTNVASYAGLQAIGGTHFAFDVTPAGAGDVNVSVPAGAFGDVAGNRTDAFAGTPVYYDATAPVATISVPGGLSVPSGSNRTNRSPIEGWSVSFDKPVVALSASNLVPSIGSTVSNFRKEGAVYLFDVVPGFDGNVYVSLPGNAVRDRCGNYVSGATSGTVVYDTVAPEVVSAASADSNEDPRWTLTFSKEIAGFSTALLQGRNVSSFSPASTSDGLVFYFATSPTSVGPVGFSVPEETLADLAGNYLPAYDSPTVLFDNERPRTLSASANGGAAYATGAVSWALAFSERVAGFSTGILEWTNASSYSTATTSDNTTFAFTATPTALGSVSFVIPAESVSDLAGNYLPRYVSPSIYFDNVAPAVVGSGAGTSAAPITVTNLSPIPWYFAFSKAISGFSTALLNGSNVASYGPVTPNASATAFSFPVYPAAQGSINVGVLAGKLADLAGNYLPAYSPPASATYDSVAPVATFYAPATPTNANPIPGWALSFSEPVTSFALSDLALGGNFSSFGSLSGNPSSTSFTFSVYPSAVGNVSVTLKASAVQDAAGNYAASVTSPNVYFDNVPPSVSLCSMDNGASYANVSPTRWFVALTKPVVNFGSLSVVNGTYGALVVSPLASNNGFENPSVFANTSNFKYQPDTTNFTATAGLLSGSGSGGTGANTFWAVTPYSGTQCLLLRAQNTTTTYTTSVTGLLKGCAYTLSLYRCRKLLGCTFNVLVDNATVGTANVTETAWTQMTTSSFTAAGNTATLKLQAVNLTATDATVFVDNVLLALQTPNVYTFRITPTIEGTVGFTIPAGTIRDSAGNYLPAYTSQQVTYDITAPVATISAVSLTGNVTNQRTTRHRIQFSEALASFSLASLATTYNVASYGNLSSSGNTYDFDVTANVQASFQVAVPAGAFTDLAGNAVAATLGTAYTYDATAPTLVSSVPVSSYTSLSPIGWTMTFSEALSSFSTASLLGTNVTSFGGLVTTSNPIFKFDVYPAAQGTVGVSFNSAVFFDAAGNSVAAYSGSSAVYDTTAPSVSVTLNSAVGSVTNQRTTQWKLAFSEPVQPLTSAMLATNYNVTSYSNLQISDSKTYYVDATAAVAGDYAAAVAGLQVKDLAGNYCLATSGAKIAYDPVAPVVVSSAARLGKTATNASPIPWAVTFSKAISNFATSALSPVNVTSYSAFTSASTGTGTSVSYSFGLYPTANGAVNVNVSGNTFSDVAGNKAAAFTGTPIQYDTVGPTTSVSLVTVVTDPTNVRTTKWAVTFSEPVASFDVALLDKTYNVQTYQNAALITQSKYEFEAVAAANGSVRVSVPGNAFTDVAGNYAGSALGPAVNYDGTPPNVLSCSPSAAYVNYTQVSWSVSFDKAIVNFSLAGLSVTNVTLSGLSENAGKTVFSFTGTVTSTGVARVDVPAATFKDSAGNHAAAYTGGTVAYDNTALTAQIVQNGWTGTYATSSNNSHKITFGKPASNFSLSALSGTNVSFSNLTQVDAKNYTFDVSPPSQGPFQVTLDAGKVTDIYGNSNDAATGPSLILDSVAPAVVSSGLVVSGASSNVVTAASDPVLTNGDFESSYPSPGGYWYNQPVPGWTGNYGIITNNSPYQNLPIKSGNAAMVIDPTGGTPQTATTTIAGLVVGRAYQVTAWTANRDDYWSDDTMNSYGYTQLTAGITMGGVTTPLASVLVKWSQWQAVVMTFVATAASADLSLTSTLASGGSVGGGALFVDSITASGITTMYNPNFDVGYNVPAAGTFTNEDPMGWGHSGAGSVTMFASGSPVSSLAPDSGGCALALTQPVTLNTAIAGLQSGQVYSINFKAAGKAGNTNTLSVSINGSNVGSATVSGQSWQAFSYPFTALSQDVRLDVALTSTAADSTTFLDSISASAAYVDPFTTNRSPMPWYMTFSEKLSSFSAGSLSSFNVTSTGPVTSDPGYTSFTFNVYPTSQGSVYFNVPAATFTDAAGNPVPAYNGSALSVLYDTVAPTVVSHSPPSSFYDNATGLSPNFTVTFSKQTAFGATYLNLPAGTTLDSISSQGGGAFDSVWTYKIQATTPQTVLSTYVKAGVLDKAGNMLVGNSASASTTWLRPITVDTTVLKQYTNVIAVQVSVSNFAVNYSVYMTVYRTDPGSSPHSNHSTKVTAVATGQTAATYNSANLTLSFNTVDAPGTGVAIAANQRYYLVTTIVDSYGRTYGNVSRIRTPMAYTYLSGAAQSLVADVAGTATVSLWGAGGGGTTQASNASHGNGGYTTGSFNVGAGQTISLFAARKGNRSASNFSGGGGGGASAVLLETTLMLEAGGGGGSGTSATLANATGCGGGGSSGNSIAGNGPKGGTQTAGGAGESGTTGTSGSSQRGGQPPLIWTGGGGQTGFGWGYGTGGPGGYNASTRAGGGGGGGYFGGGAGGNTNGYGGGGGSGYVNNALVTGGSTAVFATDKFYNVAWTYGRQDNDGLVVVCLPF